MRLEQAFRTTITTHQPVYTFEKLNQFLDPEFVRLGFEKADVATVRKRRLSFAQH